MGSGLLHPCLLGCVRVHAQIEPNACRLRSNPYKTNALGETLSDPSSQIPSSQIQALGSQADGSQPSGACSDPASPARRSGSAPLTHLARDAWSTLPLSAELRREFIASVEPEAYTALGTQRQWGEQPAVGSRWWIQTLGSRRCGSEAYTALSTQPMMGSSCGIRSPDPRSVPDWTNTPERTDLGQYSNGQYSNTSPACNCLQHMPLSDYGLICPHSLL